MDQPIIAAVLFAATSVAALNYCFQKPNATAEDKNLAYFDSKKILAMKDMLIIKMLEENEQGGEATFAWVVTDPDIEDNPIIYASSGFCALTQYHKHEIENRNCRFLQGPKTLAKDVQKIRQAIKDKKECSACLINYRKDGSEFVNQFFLCPLFDEDNKIAYFVGVQAEVSEIAEHQEGANIGWRIFKWL